MDHSRPEWIILDSNSQPVNRPRSNKDAMFFGKTCDSMDFIAMEKCAPKYEVGDMMIFHNMGAYTSATATRFNGFPLIPKIYIDEAIPQEDISSNNNIIYLSIL
jgi:diaminopimelate decarboxylase